MNLPSTIYAFRWLLRDTFRQARFSGLFWLMLAVSALCVLVCFSVDVVGSTPLRNQGEPTEFLPRSDPQAKPAVSGKSRVDVVSGDLTLAFGAFRVQLGRDGADAIRFLQLLLAGAVADTAGILLALIWTAGFLPSFLEAGAAVVLLAKPVPRGILLLGKFLGVLTFVGFQALVFVGGTWLALGIRTGYWDLGYLLCIPLLLLHFAVFFSFSMWLAVYTRNTIVCVIGSLGFWFLCWGMNFARHSVVAMPSLDPAVVMPAALQSLVEAGYWILPKPADMSMILSHALHAETYFSTMPAFETVAKLGQFSPEFSVLSSVIFLAVLVFCAARQLAHTDY
ncbi:MAG TPA: ABC transporter permease subunit [Gemmataceae bacterium]|jgi:ABC-type transport system involved in multi-copper enzyme maturation permease subunit|nr:ABC transporter permease subunit [Gemmataceae bacterium]